MSFQAVEGEVQRILLLDNDPLILLIVYSSYFASFLDGRPPVWLMILGPPGCGKTKLLEFVGTNSKGVIKSKVSPAAFLSGYDEKQSLLTLDIDGKVLVVKDMSTLIDGDRTKIAEMMGNMRYVYDGEFAPHSGKGALYWKGKLGFLGACTPELENKRQFLSALGDRFMYVKFRPYPDQHKLMNYAMFKSGAGNVQVVEDNIYAITQGMVDNWNFSVSQFYNNVITLIRNAAMIMVRLRSNVPRDSYNKEVIGVPCIETPTRIAQQLLRICLVAHSFGATQDMLLSIVRRFMYDSIPNMMQPVFKFMLTKPNCSFDEIGTVMHMSKTSAFRYVENQLFTGAISRDSKGLYILDPVIIDSIIEWGV